MHKKFLYILLIFNSFRIYCQPLWTFFSYIAADNSLNADAYIDLKEMERGANDNVNVLSFFSTLKNKQKFSQKIIISNKKANVVSTNQNLDSGSVNTFIGALTWAIQSSKTNYFLIDFWNHGYGPLNPLKAKRGVCFDDTTGNYLTDIDLKNALIHAVKLRNGKKIDIVCFDACLMASIEIEAAIADYVNYVVASEQTIPATGFNYTPILKSIQNNPNPESLCKTIVAAYKQQYTSTSDYTLSTVNSSKIRFVSENINKVAALLISLLSSNQANSFRQAIKKSINKTTAFYEPMYIDLNDFYTNLLETISKMSINYNNKYTTDSLKNLLINGKGFIKQAVINNTAGASLARAAGLSIYLPQDYIDSSYPKLDWVIRYPNWLKFLKIYLGY